MLIAATAASPYIADCPFKSIVAMLFSDCLIRLGNPVAIILPGTANVWLILCIDILVSVLPVKNIARSIIKLIVCDNAVDKPAPDIPMFIPNIKSISPPILIAAPVISPIVPSLALPSYLSRLLSVRLDVKNGADIIIYII